MNVEPEDFEQMLVDAGATPRMRARLAELKELRSGDLTFGVCAHVLGIKPDTLKKSVYRAKLKRRAQEKAEAKQANPEPELPETPDPDAGPDEGRNYAAFLLKTIERPGIGKRGGGNIAPPEGDRDRIRGKRVTVDDVDKIVKRLATARAEQ